MRDARREATPVSDDFKVISEITDIEPIASTSQFVS
jgi:hypothetical protein